MVDTAAVLKDFHHTALKQCEDTDELRVVVPRFLIFASVSYTTMIDKAEEAGLVGLVTADALPTLDERLVHGWGLRSAQG